MELRICLVMLRSSGFMFCCRAVIAALLASPWLVLELSGAGCWSCCAAPAIKEALKNSVAPRSDKHFPNFEGRCIFQSPFSIHFQRRLAAPLQRPKIYCDSDKQRLVRFTWRGYTAKRVDLWGASGTAEGYSERSRH